MNNLVLEPWQPRPYGLKAKGFVETDTNRIPVTVRQPQFWTPEHDLTVVDANGITAGENSMRLLAIAATAFDHRGITVSYTNKESEDVLQHNAEDIAAVVKAASEESAVSAIGLSMGGAVLTLALEEVGDLLESVTLIAPGSYLLREYYKKGEVPKRLLAAIGEAVELRGRPKDAAYLTLTGIKQCLQRRKAVPAELRELVNCDVHQEYQRAINSPNAPVTRIILMLGDRLIPAYAQIDSIKDLRFNYVQLEEGDHGRVAYDSEFAHQIYRHPSLTDKTHPRFKARQKPLKAKARKNKTFAA